MFFSDVVQERANTIITCIDPLENQRQPPAEFTFANPPTRENAVVEMV